MSLTPLVFMVITSLANISLQQPITIRDFNKRMQSIYDVYYLNYKC